MRERGLWPVTACPQKARGCSATLPGAHAAGPVLSRASLPCTFSLPDAHSPDTLPSELWRKFSYLSHTLTHEGYQLAWTLKIYFYKLMKATEFLPCPPSYWAVSSFLGLLILTCSWPPNSPINSLSPNPACLFMTQKLLSFTWLSVFLNE